MDLLTLRCWEHLTSKPRFKCLRELFCFKNTEKTGVIFHWLFGCFFCYSTNLQLSARQKKSPCWKPPCSTDLSVGENGTHIKPTKTYLAGWREWFLISKRNGRVPLFVSQHSWLLQGLCLPVSCLPPSLGMCICVCVFLCGLHLVSLHLSRSHDTCPRLFQLL